MLSIIIPTIGRHQQLLRLLTSISQQNFAKDNLEVLVVFNQSAPSQNLPSLINEKLKVKTLISGKKGANHARNTGLTAAMGDILLFIDDDCILQDTHYLHKIVSYHLLNPQSMAIGGSYSLSAKANFWEKVYHFNQSHWLKQQGLAAPQTRALLGGNASYKKRVFDDGLRFTPGIIYGGSETPLNMQIFSHYGPLLLFDDLVIEHQTQIGFLSFINKAQLQGRGFAVQAKMMVEQLSIPEARPINTGLICWALWLYDYFFMVGFRTSIQERRFMFWPLVQEAWVRIKKPFSYFINSLYTTHKYVRSNYANRSH